MCPPAATPTEKGKCRVDVTIEKNARVSLHSGTTVTWMIFVTLRSSYQTAPAIQFQNNSGRSTILFWARCSLLQSWILYHTLVSWISFDSGRWAVLQYPKLAPSFAPLVTAPAEQLLLQWTDLRRSIEFQYAHSEGKTPIVHSCGALHQYMWKYLFST